MTGLFLNGGFICCCFLTTVVSEKVLPPENVHLSWIKDLKPQVSWTHPNHSMQNCSYKISSTTKRGPSGDCSDSSPWIEYRKINGGFLNISIRTVCSGRMSEPVFVGFDDPDLHLSCVVKSKNWTHCSWKSDPGAQLNFSYDLSETGKEWERLQECPHYSSTGNGCDLQMDPRETINVLLNGTKGNRTICNVFRFETLKLSLPPLKWTVTKSKGQFNLSWTEPLDDFDWTYVISYTVCGKPGNQETADLSLVLPRDPGCAYSISIKGKVENFGGTDWNTVKFDAIEDPGSNVELFAFILTPLVLAMLVVLTLFLCLKNKDKIFPKVPQPNAEIFKDLINSNKLNVPNINFPKLEEECKVTLVVDPNQAQL